MKGTLWIVVFGIYVVNNINQTFAATTTTCGGTVSASSTTYNYITSPSYPNGTNNMVSCVWVINTVPGKNIKIQFLDATIRKDIHNNCVDSVQVFDGSFRSSKFLGTVCGAVIPSFASTGTTLRLEYKTAGPSYLSKFKLRYIAGNLKVCGDSRLAAAHYKQYITSSDYPAYTTKSARCAWRIDGRSGQMNLTALSFSVSNTTNCVSSYLRVFDGYDETATLLGSWCGTSFTRQQSSGRYLYVIFIAPANAPSKFKLEYLRDGSRSESSPDTGYIAGGVVGGLVFVIIVCVLTVAAVKRNQSVPFSRFL